METITGRRREGERDLLLLVSVGADLAAVLFADEHDEG